MHERVASSLVPLFTVEMWLGLGWEMLCKQEEPGTFRVVSMESVGCCYEWSEFLTSPCVHDPCQRTLQLLPAASLGMASGFALASDLSGSGG